MHFVNALPRIYNDVKSNYSKVKCWHEYLLIIQNSNNKSEHNMKNKLYRKETDYSTRQYLLTKKKKHETAEVIQWNVEKRYVQSQAYVGMAHIIFRDSEYSLNQSPNGHKKKTTVKSMILNVK